MYKNDIPPIAVYSHDKRLQYGTLGVYSEFQEDIRFNTCSEVTLTVPQKFYDPDTEKWVNSPLYDKLRKDNLLYVNDNKRYFCYPNMPIGDDDFYLKSISWVSRPIASPSYDSGFTKENTNWELNKEIELFDIGTTNGYNFESHTTIDEYGQFKDLRSDSGTFNYSWRYLACKAFIPISKGDIIALKGKNLNNIGKGCAWRYTISYYTASDASTYVSNIVDGDDIDYDGCERIYFNEEDGYIRISVLAITGNRDDENIYRPASDWIHIYSGQRTCVPKNMYDSLSGEDLYNEIPCNWFIIDNVNTINDGIAEKKEITAYSYEYILSKRTFSLSSTTLPLYVPESIINFVNSTNMVFDFSESKYKKGKQRLQSGLLNQILKYLPNWKIGSVSNDLMKNFRTFDDVDNANLYNFLMSDVQSKYNCFFVFDNEKQTISAYTWKDLINNYKGVYGISEKNILSWDIAIKELKIDTSNDECVTALQVHTDDDLYGISLVNPMGNNYVYNFDNEALYEKSMDFIPDTEKGRTLREGVSEWKKRFDINVKPYRDEGLLLIAKTKQYIEQKSKVAQMLSDYRSVADKINVLLAHNHKRIYFIPEKPLTKNEMTTGAYKPLDDYANYDSKELYLELLDFATSYEESYAKMENLSLEIKQAKVNMRSIAHSLSLNNALSDNNPLPFFTEKEIMALDSFIKEGIWTDEGTVFSETYDAKDIYDTLIDVYNRAVTELKDRLSLPNYEFSVTMANIFAVSELQKLKENVIIGSPIYLENPSGGWYQPVLLNVHINYKDDTDFSMDFSTDYKSKPKQLRFSKLFSTINQVSVQTPTFTFDD